MSPLSTGAQARILAAMRGELKSAPKASRWKLEVAGVIGSVTLIALAVGAALVSSGNADVSVIGARAGVLAMCGLVCAFTAMAALVPGAQRGQAIAVAAFVVASVALVLMRREVAPSSSPEWVCTVSHLGVGFVPLVIGLVALRRSDLKLLAGLALGVAAGTTGAMVGELACGRDAMHVLLFHVSAWVLMVVAGVVLSRVVRPRSHAP
ncbi:MAG: DUF1109 domain-containing protein [Archangium sp.]|nr:DUF1109 domain-containing protein [Archangium sp.]